MPITTNVESSNPTSRAGEVYSIQHYVIRFVSDLRHVGGFLRVLRFHPPIKLTATLNTTNLTLTLQTLQEPKAMRTKRKTSNGTLRTVREQFSNPCSVFFNNQSTLAISRLTGKKLTFVLVQEKTTDPYQKTTHHTSRQHLSAVR